ncbi:MAG: aldehyde dehydrogenase family protein [Thermosulfidibacteraceae bacterium]|jgi:acyl-CoA reductase-like NAD-dependent aldehyde dehydrogenase
MRMLLAGEWVERSKKIEVRNPYDNSVIDTVPLASKEDAILAIESAKKGQKEIAKLSAYERYEILMKAAKIMESRKEELAQTVAMEVGKTIREARTEISRALQTLTLSAEEAKRVIGEEVRFDGVPTGKGKIGMYIRVPVGIVVAISPFNFPVNLSMHKIAPALACGNAVILKPASLTPLACLKLGEIFLEAGIPPLAFQVITGPGGEVGETLAAHPDVRKVSFTGSRDVGKRICQVAGYKKITMELGSNSAVIVAKDADMNKVFPRVVLASYALAGQVCISVQRIFVEEEIFDEFVDRFIKETDKLKVGNQLLEETDVGPMIEEKEAIRIEEWIGEGIKKGAKLVRGGRRNGAIVEPTILIDCPKDTKLFREEAFGPVVIINRVKSFEEGIEETNDSIYGLQAGIFTENIKKAWKAVLGVEAGGVIINDVPTFRVDIMPYGGVKDSGIGREGPKYAIEEMTEIKLICFDIS